MENNIEKDTILKWLEREGDAVRDTLLLGRKDKLFSKEF